MIWQLSGKVWPRKGSRLRRYSGYKMAGLQLDDEDECHELLCMEELHVCDADCPLLIEEGQCPNAVRALDHGHEVARGRASLGESRLPYKRVRRQSLSSSWREQGSRAGSGLLKPLSTDSVLDNRFGAAPSPGLVGIRSVWSASDLNLSPTHRQPHDLETMSKDTLSVPRTGTLSVFSSDTDLPISLATSSLSNVSGSLGERMHELVRAFSSRTKRCKERISQPPTPSSTSSYDAKSAVSGADDHPPQPRTIRLGSFLPMGSRTSDAFSDGAQGFVGVGHCRFQLPRWCKRFRFPETFESYSKLYVSWLFVVMITYVYNSAVIPLRAVFPYQTADNWRYWLVLDYLCDVIYLIDIIVFKTRLRFTYNGIVETSFAQTKKHYFRKWMFKLDILSLLPLDLSYFWVDQPWQRKYAWLRLPRMLKIQTFWEFYARCDQAAKSSAHAVRIIKTMTYMLYLIHIETCGYYAVSEFEGLNSNRWVYNNQGNAYLRCFYLATKTATSIGNNPKPTNNVEYLFMTSYWLSGVFVFALLIGQIRDIVEAAGQVKANYWKKMDSALHYMQSINISKDTQDRARQWFLYNWEQSKTIDERSLVAVLPHKLQTDLAISVHFNTLSKVQLFQDCERNLLYDLVLKLKPNLFLPGDYVCKKGEVGKEMYIVSQGKVQVVGGDNNEVVLATLSEGSVFGEISLLAMSGRGNRRTADVRSSGYTNVFTLSKSDFEEAMNEYPEAQKLLRKRAKKLLRENAKKMEKKVPKVEAEEIIKTPNETPKLVKTVIQVLKPESHTAQRLHSSLKKSSGSGSSVGQLLQVPVPQKKVLRPREAAANMAFDFSGEPFFRVNPAIKNESFDTDDNKAGDDDDEEVLVVERIEQDLPDDDSDKLIDHDDLQDSDDEDDDDDDDDRPISHHSGRSNRSRVSEARSYEQEFFDNVMSELRAQDVIGRDEAGDDIDEESDQEADLDEPVSGDRQEETLPTPTDGEKPVLKDKDKGRGQREQGESSAAKAAKGESGHYVSSKAEKGKGAFKAKPSSHKRTEGRVRAVGKDDKGGEDSQKVTQRSGEQRQQRKTSGEHRKTSGERRKTSEVFGAKSSLTHDYSVESMDSGLPSMKRSPSVSTGERSSSQTDSKESLTSGDFHLKPAHSKERFPRPWPEPLVISNIVTVGLGGVDDQEGKAADETHRVRKLSTVFQPQDVGDGGVPSNAHPAVTVTSSQPRPASGITPVETGDSYEQANGSTSRKTSEALPRGAIIPLQNQVTCAAEIHREKTKTPTSMTGSIDQPPSSAVTPPAVAAVQAAAAVGSARGSPVPSAGSPLLYQMSRMRETIV